jgi:feruloyl esterase
VNLDAFAQHGGKLIMYHGWDDPDISIYNSINYYSAVVDDLQHRKQISHAEALAEVQKSARFFAVPGMGHCGSGPGPTNFDPLTTLDQWVNKGVAPEKIEASHMANGVKTLARPLCPYPQIAVYDEKGDRKDPGSWACTREHWNFALYDRYFYGNLPPMNRGQ